MAGLLRFATILASAAKHRRAPAEVATCLTTRPNMVMNYNFLFYFPSAFQNSPDFSTSKKTKVHPAEGVVGHHT